MPPDWPSVSHVRHTKVIPWVKCVDPVVLLTQNSHKVISINRYYQLSWLTLVTQQLFYWSTNRSTADEKLACGGLLT